MDKFKLDGKILVIVILAILLLLGTGYHFNEIQKHNTQHQQDKNLQNALSDTLHTFKNSENQWVSEKLTLQAETKDLKNNNLVLTQNQSDLIKKVDEINKHSQIISAALIQMGVRLDGIVNNKPIIENDSTIEFSVKNDSLDYNIVVNNVKSTGYKLPELEFKYFNLPNTQTIVFSWKDDRKEGYPINFSVTNSNSLYKIYDLNSYAIPELTRAVVKPTFLMKLGKLSKSTGGKITILGVGIVAGFLGGQMLVK